MKKILSMAAAALLLVSCNGNASKNETLSDSISNLMGEMYGYGIASQMKNGPDSAKFDKAAFIQGMEMVANIDTAEMSKLQVCNSVCNWLKCKCNSSNNKRLTSTRKSSSKHSRRLSAAPRSKTLKCCKCNLCL